MKKIHSNIFITLMVLSLVVEVPSAFAQEGITAPTAAPLVPLQNTTPTPAGSPAPAPATAGSQPASSASDKYLIKNPLKSTSSLSQVLLNVITIVRILLIMAAVLYLLYAGFMFVTARGEAGKIVKARNALLWGCVGIALILTAQVIITSLQNTVNGILS